MANGYTTYVSLRDTMARALRDKMMRGADKQMKRIMRAPGWSDEVMKRSFELPSVSKTIDAAVLLDEFQWEKRGSSILFPESTDLCEMLWRAKMNIKQDSLEEFPESFVVSWPRNTVVNGYTLPPIMVTWCSFNDRNDIFSQFKNKYLNPLTGRSSQDGYSRDMKILHMTYSLPHDGPEGGNMYFRSSVPHARVTEVLESNKVMYDIGVYSDNGMTSDDLKGDEVDLQWTLERLVLHLLVYMQACPDAVKPGWPDNVKERHFRKKNSPTPKPTKIGGPKMPKGTHAGPIPHWRDAHARSYPIRKDGTRKKGVIWVCGCVVAAKVDPTTIVEVEDGEQRASA